jgi:hypothetical protein
MKTRKWFVLFLALALVSTGCSEEKKEKKDEEKVEESGPAITPLTKEAITQLLTTPVEGMEAKRNNVMQTVGIAHYQTPPNEKKVYLDIKVTAQTCELKLLCPELTLAGFESRKDQLMQGTLGKKHMENPAHVFGFGEHEYGGVKAISTHAMSFVKNGPSSSHTSVFRLYSHDGTNLLMVEANPRGSWPKSQEELAALASKEELQAGAEAAFKAYAAKVFQK